MEKGRQYKDRLIYLYLFSMIMGLFIRNAMGISIPVAFFVIISVVPLIIGDNDHMLAVVVSCIATSAGFQYKYVLLLFVVIYIVKRKGKIPKSPVLFIVVIMAIWELAHCFYGEFSFVEWLRSFAELFVLSMATCMNMRKINYKLIYRAFSLAMVGICIVMLYLQYKQGNGDILSIFTRSAASFRFGLENTDATNFSLNLNPNGLGARCGLSMIMMIFLHLRRENNKVDTMLLILSLLFGIATLSRTFILCISLALIGFAILTGNRHQRLKYLIGVLIVGGGIYIIIDSFFPTILENIIIRFNAEDITNGRSGLFFFYLAHIFSSPFFFFYGIGMQNITQKIYSIYGGFSDVCHNGFQEIWVLWGIVGIILFISMIVAMIKLAKRYRKKIYLIQYIPLMYILAFSMGGQLITASHMLLALVIAYINLTIDYGKAKTNE